MDFVSYIRSQSERLHSRHYVNYLWNELEGAAEEEAPADSIAKFNTHLPLLLEQFWETAREKISHGLGDTCEDVDEELRKYLLVLLYQCTTQSQEFVSHVCLMHASEVYLHLLSSPLCDELFKTKLYKSVLTTLQTSLETGACQPASNRILRLLRAYLARAKMATPELELTAAAMVLIVFTKPDRIYQDFLEDNEQHAQSHSFNAYMCLKTMVQHETVISRRFRLITYLFNGLRKCQTVHLTPYNYSLVQASLRNLLRSLDSKFKDDDYKTFLNALIHVWYDSSFIYYQEAVLIMNELEQRHYRTLVDYLIRMLSSKPIRNFFRISLAMICNPPKHSPIEKVKVNNQVLFRSILMNTLSSKSDVSDGAVEAVAEILMSPDLQKEHINVPVKNILNGNEENLLKIPTVLRALKTLMVKKWSQRCRNKPLFGIVLALMTLGDQDYPELYHEVLGAISEEASPHDLKPFLPLLSETYLKMCEKERKSSAHLLLRILFKMALHPMASSTEYVKFLYTSMVFPTACKGVTIRSDDFFIDPIISSDFNFVEFFQKCHTLGLIKREHVVKLMGGLHKMEQSDLRLLCAIVAHTDYKELSVIADHVNDNFLRMCNEPHLNYVFYIYNKLLGNTSSSRNQTYLRSNEIMTYFVKNHLMKQSFRYNAVANAFSLLKSLGEFTNLEEDFDRLKQEYDAKLTAALRDQGSFLPVFYYSQLVLFGRVVPSDENVDLMTTFLQICNNESYRRSQDFNPKLWIGCLLLYTNICIVRCSLVETGLDFLRKGLESPATPVRLASVNMTFDLCNMVTHNFEDLIKFMFRQLVVGDSVFKRTCLLKIDRLIRDDYLKLDLDQFLIMMCLLGDKDFGLGEYLNQLLSESFFISNTSVIAKFFVPMIIHINGYSRHPIYSLGNAEKQIVQIMAKKISDRRKIYSILFSHLPVKYRFTIVYILALHILEKTVKGQLKCDEGYWKMLKDVIYIFKLVSSSARDVETQQDYYKKVVAQITKHISQRTDSADKGAFPEHQKEITAATSALLRLLFFSDSINIQKHLRVPLFDAIMHWTGFLLTDLAHIVHVDRCREIQNLYGKVEGFYKKNANRLRPDDDCFESSASSISSADVSGTSSIFNLSSSCAIQFDDAL